MLLLRRVLATFAGAARPSEGGGHGERGAGPIGGGPGGRLILTAAEKPQAKKAKKGKKKAAAPADADAPPVLFTHVGTPRGPWEVCRKYNDPDRQCHDEDCPRAHYCSYCGWYEHPSYSCEFWKGNL